ncbi:MAG: hypothetical protein ACKVU1_15070 [bacterium]
MSARRRTRVLLAAAAAVLAAVALIVGALSTFGGGGSAVLGHLAQEARVRLAGEDARSRAAVDSLRADFNRASSSTRVVAILSPT